MWATKARTSAYIGSLAKSQGEKVQMVDMHENVEIEETNGEDTCSRRAPSFARGCRPISTRRWRMFGGLREICGWKLHASTSGYGHIGLLSLCLRVTRLGNAQDGTDRQVQPHIIVVVDQQDVYSTNQKE